MNWRDTERIERERERQREGERETDRQSVSLLFLSFNKILRSGHTNKHLQTTNENNR